MEKKWASWKEKLAFEPKRDLITLAIITAVCFIQSAALNGFYVPHHFLSGGVMGISMLFNYVFGFPTWPLIVAFNIPICLIALKRLSPKTVLFSVVATVMLSATFALTGGLDFGVKNPIISAIAGAVIIGISGAAVIRRDATMGGLDLITAMLSRRYSISMGTISILFNVVIKACLSFVGGLELALTSMLGMFVSNMAFNFAMKGLNRTNTVFIISDKWEEIAPVMLSEMHRGITYLNAEGAYTGKPKKLVYCILRTAELSHMKRIVKERDPNALFAIIETKEVVGRGFSSFN